MRALMAVVLLVGASGASLAGETARRGAETMRSVQAGAGPWKACYRYTERLTLSGSLMRRTYPGPPNYESVARGDRPETVWVLLLRSPICMEANEADTSGLDGAVSGVGEVQLSATGRQPGVIPGRSLRVSGTVFMAHTGHHHTPIVMQDVKIEDGP